MAEMSDTWQGIARDAIDWAPETDESLCIGCGLCVTENKCARRGEGQARRDARRRRGQGTGMTSTDYILLAATAALVGYSALRSRQKTKKALRVALKQFLNVLPFFLAVFAMIGLLEVLLTPRQIQAWLGAQQGALAPIYAAIFGGLGTGPPAAVFPLGQYLLAQHASVAAVATLLIAWVSVGTVTLPAEMRFFGARFAMSRWALALTLSIVLGLVMGRVL